MLFSTSVRPAAVSYSIPSKSSFLDSVMGNADIINHKIGMLKYMFTKVIYIWIRHTTPSYAKFSFQSHTDFTVFYRLYSWGPVDRSMCLSVTNVSRYVHTHKTKLYCQNSLSMNVLYSCRLTR